MKRKNEQPRLSGHDLNSELTTDQLSVYSVVTDHVHFGLALFVRDFQVRYRRAFLRFFWALVPTISMMLLVVLVATEMGIDTTLSITVPYPIFLVTGFVAWSLFRDGVTLPIQMCRRTRTILNCVSIPHYGILIAAATYSLLNFLFLLPVMVGVFVWYGIGVELNAIPIVMVSVLLLLSSGVAIGMFLSPISLIYLDIRYGIQFFLMIWLFLSPVFYYPAQGSFLEKVVFGNPITYFIFLFRNSLLGLDLVHLEIAGYQAICVALLLYVGSKFFRRGLKIASQLI